MTDKHTPGPWVRDPYGTVRGPNGREVLTTGFALTLANSSKDSDAIANARLMVAAPDLLAAVKSLMKWARQVPDEVIDGEGTRGEFRDDMDAARAAIAKATTP